MDIWRQLILLKSAFQWVSVTLRPFIKPQGMLRVILFLRRSENVPGCTDCGHFPMARFPLIPVAFSQVAHSIVHKSEIDAQMRSQLHPREKEL